MNKNIGNISINEALEEFYKLKEKYENNFKEKYIKPILNSKKSKKEKRIDYSKLPKPECINCKRNVGSVFTIYLNDSEYLRHFIVKCGDLVNPCALDIQFNYSIRETFSSMIEKGLKEIDNIKLEIIKTKNNALFLNKSPEILSIFDKLTTELKLLTEDTGITIETNLLRNDNTDKKNILQLKLSEFGKGCIIPFKSLIKDYIEKQDILYIDQAIQFYINEMKPKLEDIQKLKYEENMVEYNENEKEYYLMQKKNSIQSKEHWFEVNDEVLAFVVGVKKEGKLNKSIKIKNQTKNKTLKLKPTLLLVEENELEEKNELEGEEKELDGEEKELEKEEKELEKEKKQENLKVNNQILYNNLLYKLPPALKEILELDPKWLEKYINMCIKNRQNGKPCNMVLPDNIQIPPKKLADNTYDFDSLPLNKLFNNLDEKYQQTLLSLFTEKNGQKDYKLLENALIKIIEDKSGTTYNKGFI
jgi:hypothetical protein